MQRRRFLALIEPHEFEMTPEQYQLVLDQCGGRLERLQKRDRAKLQQKWREVFAAELFARKGRWRYRGFDWHVFSYGFADAVVGARAFASYEEHQAQAVLVCPDGTDLPAVVLSNAKLPDFRNAMIDVLVSPTTSSGRCFLLTRNRWDWGPIFPDESGSATRRNQSSHHAPCDVSGVRRDLRCGRSLTEPRKPTEGLLLRLPPSRRRRRLRLGGKRPPRQVESIRSSGDLRSDLGRGRRPAPSAALPAVILPAEAVGRIGWNSWRIPDRRAARGWPQFAIE